MEAHFFWLSNLSYQNFKTEKNYLKFDIFYWTFYAFLGSLWVSFFSQSDRKIRKKIVHLVKQQPSNMGTEKRRRKTLETWGETEGKIAKKHEKVKQKLTKIISNQKFFFWKLIKIVTLKVEKNLRY